MRGPGRGIFDLDPNDHDVEAVLTRLGLAYVRFLCRPEKASAIRTVIAIAERMPELGRRFYESGPARGIALLAAYIAAQVDAGVLVVEDSEIAAAQLMESCQAMIFKSMVFNFVREPSQQQIERVVRIAIAAFLAAYRAPANPSRQILGAKYGQVPATDLNRFAPVPAAPRFPTFALASAKSNTACRRYCPANRNCSRCQTAAVRQRQHRVADDLLLGRLRPS